MTQDASSLRPRVYLPALITGILLYCSFFPLSLGFLAWVALVPWLSLVKAPRERLYRAAFLGGIIFYLPVLQWMRVAHIAMYGTWIVLALYCTLCMMLALALARKLDRVGLPMWVSAPVARVSMEYFRAHFPTGFPWLEPFETPKIGFGWYFLGYTQHDYLPVIQIADITGVYGISFLIVLVNVAIYQWVSRISSVQNWLRWQPAVRMNPIPATILSLLLVAATIGYGERCLDHEAFAHGPVVALIQSNIPQEVKNEASQQEAMASQIESTDIRLGAEACNPSGQEAIPDLVIWPETSYFEPWPDASPELADTQMKQQIAKFQAPIRKRAAEWRRNMLFGLSCDEVEAPKKYWKYNSALLIEKGKFKLTDAELVSLKKDGVPDIVIAKLKPLMDKEFDTWKAFATAVSVTLDQEGLNHYLDLLLKYAGPPSARYDKIHLVPFGEYVPLGQTFPWMKTFSPYNHEYSCKPGSHWTRFPLKANGQLYHFGCVICYEDSDPGIARSYAIPNKEGQPPVDFMVNISNDGWFKGTPEHEEHLAINRLRAVECRRAVVRSVNMGISGIIDSDGRIVVIPRRTWHESKAIEAVVRGEVPIDTRESIYAKWGDWVPLGCWLVILCGMLKGAFGRKGRQGIT